MRTLILVIALTTGVLAQSPPAGSLDAARERYTSADYHGALEMLDHLAAANPSPQERQAIDLYRTFCLIALDRMEEADEAIAAMITRDPFYRPADADVPPRLRPMFSEKRRTTLPAVIQAKYETAKSAFDRSEFKEAADDFTQVLIALSDPDLAGQVGKPPLSDLRVLAAGFNDLTVKAMTPQTASEPVPARVLRPDVPTQPPEPARAAALATPTIYDTDDAVVAPVTVVQDMPRLQRPITTDKTGVLVVVINEAGRVESAVITQPLNSYYDATLLQAVKTWRYQPAMRNGVAVKYRKRIQLTLARQPN